MVDRQHFAQAVDRLLNFPASPADQGSPTMAKVVVATPEIPDRDFGPGSFLVNGFEFRRIGGSWKWTAAFTDDTFFPKSETDHIPRTSPLRTWILDPDGR